MKAIWAGTMTAIGTADNRNEKLKYSDYCLVYYNKGMEFLLPHSKVLSSLRQSAIWVSKYNHFDSTMWLKKGHIESLR